MDSAAIAAALATLYGATAAPSGESAIALATHQLPDELKAAELPALLAWPPLEDVLIQSGMDRSELTFPVVLYLARAAKTTQQRIASLYLWRDAIRVRVQTTHSHLSMSGIAAAMSTKVTVNDLADIAYANVNYDTIRIDTWVKVYEAASFVP